MAEEILKALATLTPYDIDLPKVRIGPERDGGYIFADILRPEQVVLSYGISTEYSFDAAMAARGHRVLMFDHTIDGIDATSPNMEWFKEGVAGATDPERRLFTIKDHLDRFALTGDDLILKMDVEGAEFPALRALGKDGLARFEQISMEIHGLQNLAKPGYLDKFVAFMEMLTANFVIFHVHANNFDGPQPEFVLGIPVSRLMEISLIRRDLVTVSPSTTVYPTELDYPNVGKQDKLLWFYPFLPSGASVEALARSLDRSLVGRGGTVAELKRVRRPQDRGNGGKP